MLSSFATLFCKRADCPASQILFDYCRSLLTTKDGDCIKGHLATCDFCGAELQLLACHRDGPAEYSFAEMPLHLRRLTEDLLQKSSARLTRFPEFGEHRELSR